MCIVTFDKRVTIENIRKAFYFIISARTIFVISKDFLKSSMIYSTKIDENILF